MANTSGSTSSKTIQKNQHFNSKDPENNQVNGQHIKMIQKTGQKMSQVF